VHEKIESYVKRILDRDYSLIEDVFPTIDLEGLSLEDADIIPLIKVMVDRNNLDFTQKIVNLDLSCNNLNNIDVSQLTWLLCLDLSHNKITKLDIHRLSSLTCLHLDRNELTELNVNNLVNLQSLRLDNNKLTSLNASNLINLETLLIPNNGLKYITLPNCVVHCVIDLNGNNLNAATIMALHQLTTTNAKFSIISKAMDLSDDNYNRKIKIDFQQCSDNVKTKLEHNKRAVVGLFKRMLVLDNEQATNVHNNLLNKLSQTLEAHNTQGIYITLDVWLKIIENFTAERVSVEQISNDLPEKINTYLKENINNTEVIEYVGLNTNEPSIINIGIKFSKINAAQNNTPFSLEMLEEYFQTITSDLKKQSAEVLSARYGLFKKVIYFNEQIGDKPRLPATSVSKVCEFAIEDKYLLQSDIANVLRNSFNMFKLCFANSPREIQILNDFRQSKIGLEISDDIACMDNLAHQAGEFSDKFIKSPKFKV
jgi:hypothetical protein